MMDEVERRRVNKALTVLIDAIEDPTTRNAMITMQHLILSLDKRIDEMQEEDC
jgi:hypothetical protein